MIDIPSTHVHVGSILVCMLPSSNGGSKIKKAKTNLRNVRVFLTDTLP